MNEQKLGLMTPMASVSVPKADLNIANAFQQSQGVYRVGDPTIELCDNPTNSTITFKGRNAADNANAAVNAYALNVDALNTSDGFVPTYDDGFTGKLINRQLAVRNLGRGLKVKSITFVALNSSGSQDASVLQALALSFVTYTVKSGIIVPKPIDLSAAIRNTQFQSGILTLEFPNGLWLNAVTQIKAYITSGATVTATIEWAS